MNVQDQNMFTPEIYSCQGEDNICHEQKQLYSYTTNIHGL